MMVSWHIHAPLLYAERFFHSPFFFFFFGTDIMREPASSAAFVSVCSVRSGTNGANRSRSLPFLFVSQTSDFRLFLSGELWPFFISKISRRN
jgi:hypothetical protein